MTPAEAAIREALAAALPDEHEALDAACNPGAIRTLLSELDALRADNANLRTVMIASAEEIAAHWDAHCDAEGYGPQNLQRRLEEGIPSKYGYTAGAFAALRARCEEGDALLQEARTGLAGGLWDYGPGQDEHDACEALIERIDARLKGAGRE